MRMATDYGDRGADRKRREDDSAEAAELAEVKCFPLCDRCGLCANYLKSGIRPVSDLPILVTLNLFQGPWPALSFDAALDESSGHGR
jgi:hypothetical protein